MLEAELDEHMGYEKSEATEEVKTNYRNGHKPKTLKSTVGEIGIEVPQDRIASSYLSRLAYALPRLWYIR